jgi:hypothetical protein
MAANKIAKHIPLKLAFFQPEIISDTVEKSYMEEYHPVGFQPDSLTDPIRFHVRGTEHWIDFQKSFFDVDCEIIGERPPASGTGAGTRWDGITDNSVTLTNNILHSLFDSIKIIINDTVVFNVENYAYLAFLEALMLMSDDFAKQYGALYLWSRDETGKISDPASTSSKTRKAWGPNVQGVLKLRVPLFVMKSYLMSFLNLDIIMNRVQSQDFLFIKTAPDTFQLKIKKITLNLRKAKLVPSYIESIEHMLAKDGEFLPYSFREPRVFTKTYSGYGTELVEDNLFHGVVPDKIWIGFVDNSAFQGHRSKNPFNFENKGISEIAIYVNGLPHTVNPISMNFTTGDIHRIYYHTLEALHTANPVLVNSIPITKNEFKEGYTLFCFDMSADQYGGKTQYNLYNAPANVQLRIKFSQSRNNDIITLIIYYEIGSRMLVDKTRRVQIISK